MSERKSSKLSRQGRDQSRHVYPSREGKVGLIAYVEPELRKAFKKAAADCGLTSEALLVHLVQSFVNQNNPAIAKEIAEQTGQIEKARKRILDLVSGSAPDASSGLK